MIWPRNVYVMIWHVNDGYIYIYVVIWYETCYGTRYVINWHVYDMICIWWKLLCLEAYNVMIWYIYVIWMIWYDWHAKRRTSMKYNPDVCMKDMINDMINDVWNGMKNDMTCTER